MSGRKKNKAFDELGYLLVRRNNKCAAFCTNCKKNLLNTAEARLRAHRNVCKIINNDNNDYPGTSNQMETSVPFMDEECEVVLFDDKGHNISMESNPINIQENRNSPSISHFLGRLPQKNIDEINESLAQFFFGCNIPLSVIESVHFKNFMKKLSPSYESSIPGRKMLSTKLLDNAYEKLLASAKTSMSSESVLLIDGWGNSSSNTNTVVSMLHNANGEQIFLEAWHLTGECETPEKLAEIITESVDLAEKMYSTNVYAVVSDNANAVKEMKNITKHFVWKSICNSHIGNLLAKDILDQELNLKVTSVLKEFKQPVLEKKIIEKGGNRIKSACETRRCSYSNAYSCLVENEQLMKQIAADSNVKSNIIGLLSDTKFIDDVKKSILLLEPICTLINQCQSKNCLVAEAVNLWLNLQLPEEFLEHLKARQALALNKYALAAYYLHPFLDNTKLSSEHNNILFDFLFNNLDGLGLEEFDSFNNKAGLFKVLFEKDIKSPFLFWSLAKIKYPNLANLATKLLQIPASSAQVEGIFSNWAHVHSIGKNRLSFEKSKKMFYIYYSLRLKDNAEVQDFEMY